MHYHAPHGRSFGGFVVLPIRPKPEAAEPKTAGLLATLFSNAKATK